MVSENSPAPDFKLKGSDGKMHGLKEFSGKYLVLYFYPKDDTPGCTTEACSFRDGISKIKKLGAEVVGISNDGLESHDKFIEKYKLNFLLLSDPESKTIKAYDSYGNRGALFGFGTLRKTFIIGKDGKLLKIFDKVHPEGHSDEVLGFLKGIA